MFHAGGKLQLEITFSFSFKDMHVYLQASPKVKGSNPLYHTAMEMGVCLGLVKQKGFFSVLYTQAGLCETELCVLNSSLSNK